MVGPAALVVGLVVAVMLAVRRYQAARRAEIAADLAGKYEIALVALSQLPRPCFRVTMRNEDVYELEITFSLMSGPTWRRNGEALGRRERRRVERAVAARAEKRRSA